ncbi:hypothetical protein RN607_13565 [Demequina capsici]|uniref:Uncharacterized protein n=1 Tax=Demequina capsici TaxID=3075620 RepID=A0AA96FBN0_9MICO|nr:hypothetical protein [Demequina sp. PMTSA13]WNM27213.1 hypothetical protein RN607_13565 [Demequina sp. PMTSA13]
MQAREVHVEIRYGWVWAAVAVIVVGFFAFSAATVVHCPDGYFSEVEGNRCGPTVANHLLQGAVVVATLAAAGYALARAVRRA